MSTSAISPLEISTFNPYTLKGNLREIHISARAHQMREVLRSKKRVSQDVDLRDLAMVAIWHTLALMVGAVHR